jgi:hypothetical protein
MAGDSTNAEGNQALDADEDHWRRVVSYARRQALSFIGNSPDYPEALHGSLWNAVSITRSTKSRHKSEPDSFNVSKVKIRAIQSRSGPGLELRLCEADDPRGNRLTVLLGDEI